MDVENKHPQVHIVYRITENYIKTLRNMNIVQFFTNTPLLRRKRHHGNVTQHELRQRVHIYGGSDKQSISVPPVCISGEDVDSQRTGQQQHCAPQSCADGHPDQQSAR